MKYKYILLSLTFFIYGCGDKPSSKIETLNNKQEDQPSPLQKNDISSIKNETPEAPNSAIDETSHTRNNNHNVSSDNTPDASSHKLIYDPELPTIPKQNKKLKSYQTSASKLKKEWIANSKIITNEFKQTIGSFSELKKRKAELYSQIKNKFSRSSRTKKEDELKEVLKIQTQVMMELTNKVFDQETLGKPSKETLNKLLNLNKKLDELNNRVNNFSSYYSELEKKELKPYSYNTKNYRGIDEKIDKLSDDIEAQIQIYLSEKKQLAEEYLESIRDQPLEIDLLYRTDKSHFIFSIYNNTQETRSLEDLKISVTNDETILRYEFSDKVFKDYKTKTAYAFLPHQISFFYVNLSSNRNPIKINSHSYTKIVNELSPLILISEIESLYSIPETFKIVEYEYTSNGLNYSSNQDILNQALVANNKENRELKLQELEHFNNIINKTNQKIDDETKKQTVLDNTSLEKQKKAQAKFEEISATLTAEYEAENKEISDRIKQIRDESRNQRTSSKSKYGSIYSSEYRTLRSRQSKLYNDHIYTLKNEARKPGIVYNPPGTSDYKFRKALETELIHAKKTHEEILKKRKQADLQWKFSKPHHLQIDCIFSHANQKIFKIRNISQSTLQKFSFSIIPTPDNQASIPDQPTYKTYSTSSTYTWLPGESMYFSTPSNSHYYSSSSTSLIQLTVIKEVDVLTKFQNGLNFDNKENTYLLQVDIIK